MGDLPHVSLTEISARWAPCEHPYGSLESLAGDQRLFTALDLLERTDMEARDRLWLALHTEVIEPAALHRIAVKIGGRSSAIWSLVQDNKEPVRLLAAKTRWIRSRGQDSAVAEALHREHEHMRRAVRSVWVEAREAKQHRDGARWRQAITVYGAGQSIYQCGRLEPRLASWEAATGLSSTAARARQWRILSSKLWDNTEEWMLGVTGDIVRDHYGIGQPLAVGERA